MGIISPSLVHWQRIGDEGLEGANEGDILWIRGPCGAQHPLSRRAAKHLAHWLDDQLTTTIEGELTDECS